MFINAHKLFLINIDNKYKSNRKNVCGPGFQYKIKKKKNTKTEATAENIQSRDNPTTPFYFSLLPNQNFNDFTLKIKSNLIFCSSIPL